MDAYRARALPYRSYSLSNIGSHKIDFSLRRLSFTMNRSSITQENAKFHMVEPLLRRRFAARVLALWDYSKSPIRAGWIGSRLLGRQL